MTTRRNFLAGATATPLAAPALAQSLIRWRLQTYASGALTKHVVADAVKNFNIIAGDRMHIDLYAAGELVPNDQLFTALQSGKIDAVQSDDETLAANTEVTVFGGYFPFGTTFSLDVAVLFDQYGLKRIWDEQYARRGVKHVSAGAWDPCHFATNKPINSIVDFDGLRIFTFPTAGKFLKRFGVIPVDLTWDKVTDALSSGDIDGLAWSGITGDYTKGVADHTRYFLTNNISGAWIGHFFANMDRWHALPKDLQRLFTVCCDQSHYKRQSWYWGSEAHLRVNGEKLTLTTIPAWEWEQVQVGAVRFWDEIATQSATKARVVDIFRRFNNDMRRAGPPYRTG